MIAEEGKKYAQIIDGKCHWIFTAAELPEWNGDAFQVVEITDKSDVKCGDVYAAGSFARPALPVQPETAQSPEASPLKLVAQLYGTLLRKGVLAAEDVPAKLVVE
ncbi:MAG TPA: hypothetical protein VLH56_02805 [Dissulfurispiraceae bacterium]|nr:hypothetical protein [Dissulfurispiraceae bacterium]